VSASDRLHVTASRLRCGHRHDAAQDAGSPRCRGAVSRNLRAWQSGERSVAARSAGRAPSVAAAISGLPRHCWAAVVEVGPELQGAAVKVGYDAGGASAVVSQPDRDAAHEQRQWVVAAPGSRPTGRHELPSGPLAAQSLAQQLAPLHRPGGDRADRSRGSHLAEVVLVTPRLGSTTKAHRGGGYGGPPHGTPRADWLARSPGRSPCVPHRSQLPK
jgi:hypothetical protein